FFSSRRRHTRSKRDWSSDVCSSDLNLAVVECAGVGYAVRTSSVTVSRLPAIGEEAMLYTYLHISENAVELFGFRDQNELSCFKKIGRASCRERVWVLVGDV